MEGDALRMQARVRRPMSGFRALPVALIAAMALLLMPAGANAAASPVLEFVVPGHSFPVSFTTESRAVKAQMAGFEMLLKCTASHGEGKVTGPRTTVSEYQLTGCSAGGEQCKSGTNAEEITTGPIEGDLVWIDQSKDQVGILMNPSGGTYISFECGGEPAEGKGPFLAPVAPLNKETTSFTATLTQSESVQTPDEYEGEKGETLYAFPTGEKNGNKFVPTGVEASFTITSSVSGYIKAITKQEIEAEQQEEEAEELEEALLKQEENLKKQEAALKKLEVTLKTAEEHAKQVGEEAKKHEEELNAQIAAIKKHQEEAAANKKHQEESKSPTRAQLLAKALKQCKKQPQNKRVQCEARAEKQYGHKTHKELGGK